MRSSMTCITCMLYLYVHNNYFHVVFNLHERRSATYMFFVPFTINFTITNVLKTYFMYNVI